MRRIVRVVCRRAQSQDNSILTFEVALRDGMIDKGRSYVGFRSGHGEMHPFFLHMDGRLDYGSAWEEERYEQTNFLTKQVQIGELFTVEEYDEDDRISGVIYTVTQIVDL